MKRARGMKNKESLVIKTVILVIALTVAAVCLYAFWPSKTEATGKLELAEYQKKALSEAQELIPEAEVMIEFPNPLGEAGVYGDSYTIKDKDGNDVCLISVDPMAGETVFFLDTRGQGPSSSVLINGVQARDITERFMLDHKGIDLKTNPIQIITEELVGKGMVGPPDNPTEVFQYELTLRETVNGVPVGDSAGATVIISPEDGRIIGYIITRKTSTSSSKEAGTIKVSEDEAIAIAIKAMQEKFQIYSEPYVSEIRQTLYDDFGNGRMTPYITFNLYFGDKDLDSTTGATHVISVAVDLETGNVIHSNDLSGTSITSEEALN